jgi:hypothetical protein
VTLTFRSRAKELFAWVSRASPPRSACGPLSGWVEGVVVLGSPAVWANTLAPGAVAMSMATVAASTRLSPVTMQYPRICAKGFAPLPDGGREAAIRD